MKKTIAPTAMKISTMRIVQGLARVMKGAASVIADGSTMGTEV